MFFFCDPVYQINVGGKKRKHSKVISDMKNIFTFYNPIRSIDRLIDQLNFFLFKSIDFESQKLYLAPREPKKKKNEIQL